MCTATSDVGYGPEADMCTARANVCCGPTAGMWPSSSKSEPVIHASAHHVKFKIAGKAIRGVRNAG